MTAADDEARKIGQRTMTGKDESGRQEMAETAEWRYGCGKDDGSGRQRRQTTTAMVAEDGGGRRQRSTTARKIGRRTKTGKVGSGRRTMTALSIGDREDDVVFDMGQYN
jgi:hypothetical protein